ncbi:MAG: radical SAM protein, partial [Candidatus Omnitrophota bacterium]
MRILLTTSLKPNPIDSPLVLSPNMMPLGLGFIAAVLEQKGHQVIIVDNYLCGTSLVGRYYHIQRFKGILRKFNPDFVGIYTYSVGFHKVLELIRLIKGFCSAKIICGGPHASEMPESFPAEVDFVVRGEGEFAVLDILEGRVTERIIKVKRIDNLDELPMPAWHLFEHKRYKLRESMYLPHAPVFNLNTSRGCPFGCKFCSVPDVWGSEYRMFSAARIIQDIEYLINKYKIKGVYFREDNFTASRNRIMEFCNLLIDKKISIEWAC